MEMTLRWYGPGYDSVTLKQIRQIPGVKNVITTLLESRQGNYGCQRKLQSLKRLSMMQDLELQGLNL